MVLSWVLVDAFEQLVVVGLSITPVVKRDGELGDDSSAEFEEGSRGRLDVGEDLAVVGEFGEVPDEPDHLGLEEVDFACFLVFSPQVWLSIHWCQDLRNEIRRNQSCERHGGGEKAGGDPGRVFGTGGGED